MKKPYRIGQITVIMLTEMKIMMTNVDIFTTITKIMLTEIDIFTTIIKIMLTEISKKTTITKIMLTDIFKSCIDQYGYVSINILMYRSIY